MRINRREKALLLVGGLMVFALMYYLFVVSPTLARQKTLERYIVKKESDLAEMMERKIKWDRFKRDKVEAEKTLARRGKKFTLLSFLEAISREVGIHNMIQYMKPISSAEESGALKGVGMEIKLEGININHLVNFLYKIEYSGKLLNIKRIKIQRLSKRKAQTLRVTLQINTYTTI